MTSHVAQLDRTPKEESFKPVVVFECFLSTELSCRRERQETSDNVAAGERERERVEELLHALSSLSGRWKKKKISG